MSLPIYLKPHEKEIREELKLQGQMKKRYSLLYMILKVKKENLNF